MVKVFIFIVYGLLKLGIDSDCSIKFQFFDKPWEDMGMFNGFTFLFIKKKIDLQFLGLWPTQYSVTELS